MARVYPRVSSASTTTSVSLERETFTLWMKSLVLHGNGLTVFNSEGEIVYRIDNYDTKHNREVCLMDLRGNVLCTLLRRPWFRVRKIGVGKRGITCQVTVKIDELLLKESRYLIRGSLHKSEFKIFDQSALLIAEVKRKKLESIGVTFGNDVLSLVVESNVDRSLVVALVAVVGLMCRRM
ncbi:hypothetical protein V2J09_020238 [Rumex salicifolius]